MLNINTVEIISNKKKANILSKDYNGNWQLLKNLREQYPEFYFYRWNNYETLEDKIFCWPIRESSLKVIKGFSLQPISTDTHPHVWSKILEVGFTSFFKKKGRKIYKKRYSHIWNLSLRSIKDDYNNDALKLLPQLKLAFHFYETSVSQNIKFFISLRKWYKPEIVFTDQEFKSRSIDTRSWHKKANGNFISSTYNLKRLLEATGETENYKKFKNKIDDQCTEFKNLTFFVNEFKNLKKQIWLPDDIAIKDLLINNLPDSNFEYNFLKKPTYYFLNESIGGGFYNERLKKLKPASYHSFKEKTVKILTITPIEYEGSTGGYTVDLNNNLRKTFHLNTDFDIITFNPNEPNAYPKLLKRLDLRNYDLVLQVVSFKDKKKPILDSPYYQFKAKALNQKVPTQKILIETIRKNNPQVKDALCLNIYSKIGGTAWTIEKDEKNKTEIIIGISSTINFQKERVIGFANVLDYRGNYITGTCTQMCSFENYKENLEEHLIQIIQEVIKIKSLSTKEEIRLIFHLTKEAGKKNELKSIENALKAFSEFDIQVGIVHLSYAHNFRVFKDNGTKPVDRGTLIQLSDNNAILHLGQSSKNPILLRLDRRSDYRDLYAIAKQVLHFAHLSHKSFRPANKPVTILYPSQMAKLLSELQTIPGWDIDILSSMKEKLWFI